MQTETVETLAWKDFLREFRFAQGEHVTLLGPTGSGKTTLALQILPQREYVVAFGCKRKDDTLSKLQRAGWKREKTWPMEPPYGHHVLWPKIDRVTDISNQRTVFQKALRGIYTEGGWTVYLDEIRYITEYLGLKSEVELLLQQGRSSSITIVGGTQSPVYVPLAFYNQATHLFLWKDSDKRRLKRYGEIGAFDSDRVAHEVQRLANHEVLYLDTRHGRMAKTNARG